MWWQSRTVQISISVSATSPCLSQSETSAVGAAAGHCVLLPMQQKTTLGSGEPFITLMVQQQTVQQQPRADADTDDTCAARLKLGHIAAKLQAALQPSAAIASTSFGLELRLLQGRVPSMLIAAFEAVSDFDRLVYPTLMQTMAEELYRGITSTQVDVAKKMMRNKLLQLIKDYSKMKEAMLLEVDKKVTEVVEMCWQKLLYSVKTQIVDKVQLYVADQQHQQQQIRQIGGFSKAVSDLIELRMYMSGMNSRIWADAQLGPQQLLPATARREAGGSSSKAAFNQPLIPTAIAQLVLQGPDVFDDETLVAILPQTQHLRQLADRVMELLQQNGVPGSNYTLHQVQQEPALVKWCAEVLKVQLPDGISAADLVQLWLGALPAEATIDELARAASEESAARPSAGTQPGQQAGDGFAAHALDDAKVIGSELYMVLLMQLLKQVGVDTHGMNDMFAIMLWQIICQSDTTHLQEESRAKSSVRPYAASLMAKCSAGLVHSMTRAESRVCHCNEGPHHCNRASLHTMI